jgi:hypothetical protein
MSKLEIPGAARIRQRDTVYRIEHPDTGMCVQLRCKPSAISAAPRIQPRLTSPELATWFANHAQAAEAFGRFIGPSPLEIVRSDA